MGVQNLSADIPYSDGTTYQNGTVGKRIQQLASDVINASVPDGSITAAKLASDAVTTVKITDANVTTAKLAANAVTLAKLVQATASDKILWRVSSGAGNWEEGAISDYWQSLFSVADEAALKAAINAEAGVDFQAYSAKLAAIAALTWAADKGVYFTGTGALATYDLGAQGRALGSGESKDLALSLRTISGTSDTPAQSDHGKLIKTTNGSGVAITLVNSLTVGTVFSFSQEGDGQITFSAASGASLRNRQSHTKTAGKWAGVTLRVTTNSGGSAAEYVLTGDTAA